MRKPKFIVVGAHKAGTTSLHYYLDEHPDIYLPAYKGGDLLANREFKQLGQTEPYLNQFSSARSDQILGEVSSAYFHQDNQFIKQLHQYFPEVQIVVILRDPIDRAYSHALWGRSYSPEELQNFDEIVLSSKKFLNPGLYATHLKKYLTHFNECQIKTFLYDDLRQDSVNFVINLYDFLGVRNDVRPDVNKRYHSGSLKIDNSYSNLLRWGSAITPGLKSAMPSSMRSFLRNTLTAKSVAPKPKMSAHLKLKLAEYYHNEIIELGQLTGLDVSHWLAVTAK